MKKIAFFSVFILLLFTAVACDKPEDKIDDTIPKTVFISGQESSMLVGDRLQLSATVNPSTAPQTVIWTSTDDSVLEVSEEGLVKAVGAGVAEIVATSSVNNKVYKKVSIIVEAPIVYDDPESVEFTSTRAEVAVGVYITLEAKVLPETASQEVLFTSDDESIARVDKNGRVTGLSVGLVTITATVVADTTLTADFQVSVVVRDVGEVSNPTGILITGETEVFENNTIFLTADVLPHGASSTVFWTSSDESIATVQANGQVKGIKQGSVFITATSAVNIELTKSIAITVKPEPFNEPYPNLQGYVITLLGSPGHTNEHDPFEDGYIAQDRVAKQEAWDQVESLFNCTIEVDDFPETAPWGANRVSWVNENAARGTHTADIMVLTTQWISQLVNGNSVVDVSEYYELYGRNQMPTAMRQASTLKGGMYALLRANAGSTYVDQGLFYNVNLVKDLGLDSPALLFNNGEWTYSKFVEYAILAKSLMDEDQSVLSGKASLYWIGMTNAAGVKLLDTNLLQVNFDNPYAMQAANTLRDIYNATGWGTNAYDSDVTSFNTGKSLFQSGEMWFTKSNDRWRADMWGEGTTEFGYVPYPRPDKVSKADTRTNGGDGECYMMVTGVDDRPPYITDAHVYRAWSEVMIRTNKQMQADESFDEELTMRNQASFRVDDPESLAAVAFFKQDKVIFDPMVYGVVEYSYISPVIDKVVMEGQDYMEALGAHYVHYFTSLSNLYG